MTRLVSSSLNDATTSAEDRRLVDRLISGDAAAWHNFVERFGALVRSRVSDVARSFGVVNDAAAIDDAVADVFAVLVRNNFAALRAFEERSSLATYIAVIATRIATRGYASGQFSMARSDDLNDPTDRKAAEPIRQLIQREQFERLSRCIAELSPKQRAVVQYFYLEQHSYQRISQLLSMPMGSVGVTLRRAEAKLRKLLQAEE